MKNLFLTFSLLGIMLFSLQSVSQAAPCQIQYINPMPSISCNDQLPCQNMEKASLNELVKLRSARLVPPDTSISMP